MSSDNGNVRPLPPEELGLSEMDYLPLPILDLQTATITLNNSETNQPESFVRILYKDIGGEKAMWLPCDKSREMPESLAVAFGEEIVRLARGAEIGGVVKAAPKLWTPS